MQRLRAAPPTYVVTLNGTVCDRAPTVEERRLIGAVEVVMDCVRAFPDLREAEDEREDLTGRVRIGHPR